MKYFITTIKIMGNESYSIQTTDDMENFKSFPADKSNSDYVQFLTDAQLTDAKVKKLTPNVWYDFPAPLPVEPPVETIV